jgi:hypothetical protein
MKIVILTCCLFLYACSQGALRSPASPEADYLQGGIDSEKSSIKIFPPEIYGSNFRYYFYLELKDDHGKYVDCDLSEVVLKEASGQQLAFKFERSSRGRYYLSVEDVATNDNLTLDLFIQDMPFRKQVKLVSKKADRNKSWLRVVATERDGLKLRLFLGDSNGEAINVPSEPEIIIDGDAQMKNLEQVGDGTWEFSLVYPNTNQVIYISARVHGIFMANMYRIQHVEK